MVSNLLLKFKKMNVNDYIIIDKKNSKKEYKILKDVFKNQKENEKHN